MGIARGRISSALMSSIFHYQSASSQAVARSSQVIFQRSELLFNDRPAIMINMRTVRDELDQSSNFLKEVCLNFPQNLTGQLQKTKEQLRKLQSAAALSNEGSNLVHKVGKALQLAQLKTESLLAVGKMQKKIFAAEFEPLNAQSLVDEVLQRL